MRLIAFLAFGALLVCVSPATPCTFTAVPPTAVDLIRRADVIVVAVARELVKSDRIRFEVTETLKGSIAAPLLVDGRFTDRDDFNDIAVPLNGTRPEGYNGACEAYHYRRDAAYLLFLQRTAGGELTPYWSPFSRVNDQIRPNGDQWLDWVRRQVAERR